MDYKDKIRKLLALAKSPEPEEAKLALLKARKLMAEHKLSERDLEERNTTVGATLESRRMWSMAVRLSRRPLSDHTRA